jgi:1-epi-valienol-7-phosphate kinase
MEQFVQLLEVNIGCFINNRRWFDKSRDAVYEVKIYDYLWLEDNEETKVLLLIVRLSLECGEKFYFVPIEVSRLSNECVSRAVMVLLWNQQQWQIKELSYSQKFNRAMLRFVVDDTERIVTHSGNCLIFEKNRLEVSLLEKIECCKPFEPNKSSNCLNYVEAGGKKYLHKIYKSLDPNNNEIFLAKKLAALDSGIPSVMGSYFYKDQKIETVFPLGVVMEFLDGNSIDKYLNQNIRSLWKKPALFEIKNRAWGISVLEHIKPLIPLLDGIAKRLVHFHQAVNCVLKADQNSEIFCLSKYLCCSRSRLERVAGFVNDDNHAGQKNLDWIARLLMKYKDTVFAEVRFNEQNDFLPGFCHGDLHLSNLLYKYKDGSDQDVKIIDFAPRCIDIASEQFLTQSPLQDIIALQRGLEYFSYDEANREISKRLHISEQSASNRQFLSLFQSLSVVEEPRVKRIAEIARRWNKLIFEVIWNSYFEDPSIYKYYSRTSSTIVISTMNNIFYLSRLLKELEYNYNYQRDDYKYVDFYYLCLFWYNQLNMKENFIQCIS